MHIYIHCIHHHHTISAQQSSLKSYRLQALSPLNAKEMAHAKAQDIEKYGPYGSQCPTNYSLMLDEGEYIKKVIIRCGYIVDALGFETNNRTETFGGCGGNYNEIVLKCNEYITKISGTSAKYQYSSSDRVISSIRIHTNLCLDGYGPYGQQQACSDIRSFSTPLPLDGPIVGFFGRSDTYLDSVGIYVEKDCKAA